MFWRHSIAKVGMLLMRSSVLVLVLHACSRQRADAARTETASSVVAARAPRAFADCMDTTVCPRMVELPGATYLMGSPPTEAGRYDDEAQRTVTVAPFAIGVYLVTRGQWKSFVAATDRKTIKAPCAYALRLNPTWEDPGFPQGDDHPVVCITWGEAHEYVDWLSARTGHVYRLPTEEEWEYAARAGTTTSYPWGETASHENANYGKDSCCSADTLGRDRWMFTSPVGSFPPNAFGLYDMQGNATEWIETCADSVEKVPRPKGASAGCAYRYGRGGVWGDRPQMLRSAAKNFAPTPDGDMTIQNYRSSGFGFRIARDVR